MTLAENQRKKTARKRSKGQAGVELLVFLIPCLPFIKLNVVGVLYGFDVLIIVSFFVLALRGKIRFGTLNGKVFMILCTVWLASQCLTDVVRHSPFADYARGWSNIGMTLVSFSVIYYLLYGNPRRLVIFGWGSVAGLLLTYFINPDDVVDADPWKWGLAYPVTWGVCLLASQKRFRGRIAIAMVTAVGMLNLVLAFRSLGAICLIAALYLLITHTMRKRAAGAQKLKKAVLVAITAFVLLCGAGIYFGYQFAATSGLLGEEAQNKNESQSSGKYGVLLGGRTEMLGYLPAIYDSPILGHGSWAKDPKYFIAEREALAALGYSNAEDMSVEDLEVGLIPTHSCLFGAWVDAGILGALFWAWMLVITAKAFMRVYPATVTILPIMSLLGFQLLWDILFSPYGAKARYLVSYEFVMVITCAGMAPHAAVQSVLQKVKKRKAAVSTPDPDQGAVPA